MSGRGLRARAPVDYNNRESMVPAWLKGIESKAANSDTPPKKAGKKATDSPGSSAEKENARKSAKAKSAKQTKSAAKQKSSGGVEKKTKQKKADPKPAKAGAERGRNQGVTVVPIEDVAPKGKGGSKAPRVSGLRASKSGDGKPGLPEGPPEPREVPGLPGVVQKAAPRPASAKRKAPAAPAAPSPPGTVVELTPTPVKPLNARSDSGPDAAGLPAFDLGRAAAAAAPPAYQPAADAAGEDRSSKRSRSNRAPAPAPAPRYNPAAYRPAPAPRGRAAVPPSPAQDFSFSPLPAPAAELERLVEEYRRANDALRALNAELQDENSALKDTSIREQVLELLEQHDRRVEERGEAAADVARHWKDEAEALAEALAAADGADADTALRGLRAELATARQALLDMDVENVEKDKALVELQKRNGFLEQIARRRPPMVNRCVGTSDDAGPAFSAGVQAPSVGHPLLQARAMAPEGAAASSLYRGFYGAGANGNGARALGADAPYSLQGQRTVAFAGQPSGSDMRLASDAELMPPPPPPQNFNNYGVSMESVQQAAAARNRRVSAPVNLAALRGKTAGDVTRQIQFYAGGPAPAQLAAVPEDDGIEEEEEEAAAAAGPSAPAAAVPAASSPASAPEDQRLPVAPPAEAPSTGILLSRGHGLLALANMEAVPLKGGRFQYTHHPTGYRFVLSPEADPDEPQEPAVRYVPMALGTAERALGAVHEGLVEEGWIPEASLELFCSKITEALALCRAGM